MRLRWALGWYTQMMSQTEEVAGIVDHFGQQLKVEHIRTGSWFTRFVTHELKKRASRGQGVAAANKVVAAEKAIRRACIKSSVTGATAGLVSTAGTLLTAELPGAIGLVTLPATAA